MKKVYTKLDYSRLGLKTQSNWKSSKFITSLIVLIRTTSNFLLGRKGASLHSWFIYFFIRHYGIKTKKYYNDTFLYPCDSVRYFELSFVRNVLNKLKNNTFESCLDISSPRNVYLMLKSYKIIKKITFINPDKEDLEQTREYLNSYYSKNNDILSFCTLITDLDKFDNNKKYDLITCISVIEHIDIDLEVESLKSIWTKLENNGHLLVTVPCAKEGFEEYYNTNMYNLYNKTDNGYHFFQRFYDKSMLEQSLFKVFGKPIEVDLIGEKQSGLFQKMIDQKISGSYNFTMELNNYNEIFSSYKTIDQLPGIGVVSLLFKKV